MLLKNGEFRILTNLSHDQISKDQLQKSTHQVEENRHFWKIDENFSGNLADFEGQTGSSEKENKKDDSRKKPSLTVFGFSSDP